MKYFVSSAVSFCGDRCPYFAGPSLRRAHHVDPVGVELPPAREETGDRGRLRRPLDVQAGFAGSNEPEEAQDGCSCFSEAHLWLHDTA